MDLLLSPINDVQVVRGAGVIAVAVEGAPEVGPQFANPYKHGGYYIAVHTHKVI